MASFCASIIPFVSSTDVFAVDAARRSGFSCRALSGFVDLRSQTITLPDLLTRYIAADTVIVIECPATVQSTSVAALRSIFGAVGTWAFTAASLGIPPERVKLVTSQRWRAGLFGKQRLSREAAKAAAVALTGVADDDIAEAVCIRLWAEAEGDAVIRDLPNAYTAA
jgi:hypothetical protein